MALQQSVEQLRGLPVNRESLSAIKSDVGQIKQQIDKLTTDAQGQYGPQVAAIKTAFSALTSSVDAAIAAPNTATLSAVRESATGVASSVSALRTSIPNC